METIHVAEQLRNLMPALGLGFLLGVLYDAVRILRLLVPSKKIFVFITDMLFTAFCAVASYVMFIALTNGRIRGYMVIAELIGAAAYFLSVSAVCFPLVKKLICKIKGIFHKLFSPFIFIFKKIKTLSEKAGRNIGKKLKKCKNKLKKPLQDEDVMLYNKSD